MGRNSELTSRRTFFRDNIENITKVLGYPDPIALDMQIFVDNSVHGLRKKNQRRLDKLGRKGGRPAGIHGVTVNPLSFFLLFFFGIRITFFGCRSFLQFSLDSAPICDNEFSNSFKRTMCIQTALPKDRRTTHFQGLPGGCEILFPSGNRSCFPT